MRTPAVVPPWPPVRTESTPAGLTALPSPTAPLVSVLVAAYNEAATLELVLRRVADDLSTSRVELIVVDDGSTDETPRILQRLRETEDLPGLRTLRHERNRGKGAAVRTAVAASTGDIVVIQDGDLEYDPRDLSRVLAPLLEGHADAVFGTRLRGGQPQRAHMFWHYAGNRFLSLLTNVLYNTTISDMEVGYKAFRGDLVRSLELESDDFTIEPELTAKLLRRGGVRLYEVPISYYGRTYEEGKKITWRHGLSAAWALLRYRWS
jgi:glycosyltransferase involved in cell wall biosynthesis